jgi:hypothetical protein
MKRLEPAIGYKYPPTDSGATYIRSTGGASNDKDQLVDNWYRRNRLPFVNNELRLHCRQKDKLLPSGVICESLKNKKNKLEYFAHSNSQTRLRHMILEMRHREKIRMP